MMKTVQILNVALLERIMHIAQLAIAGLKCPLLMRVEIPQPHVVDNHVFNERVPAWLKTYRSMQICMLISCPSLPTCSSAFSSGMKYFLMRSRQ
jgi:hypothetical protein